MVALDTLLDAPRETQLDAETQVLPSAPSQPPSRAASTASSSGSSSSASSFPSSSSSSSSSASSFPSSSSASSSSSPSIPASSSSSSSLVSSSVFAPGVPVLLEEISPLLRLAPPPRPPRVEGGKEPALSLFSALLQALPRVPSDVRSVRVFGEPVCFLHANAVLIQGVVNRRARLLVDLSWLPPSVVAVARAAVDDRRGRRRGGARRRAGDPSDFRARAEDAPMLQFIGEISRLSLSLLEEEQRANLCEDDPDDEESEEKENEERGREEETEGEGNDGEKKQPPDRVCRADKRRRDLDEGGGKARGARERDIDVLRARVCRRVDGLEVGLYLRALCLFRRVQAEDDQGENTILTETSSHGE
ncbi:hypothetical protein BESB_011850 [Besnoitia besnoiti]|uniref:Uncharacterized protein n=1 Tax=Besnoitia besnoiti TaxID=94643 RepID=A0A2A9MA64_BESBE|nr:hypothetical protein BESB_011850 [Besnoitia besnoiti]PFH32573.1 hypothetical protein BESB_011850 [Besnoitia besnoiti]